MKYMLLLLGDEMGDMADPAVAQMYEAIGQWWGEHTQAGHIVGGHQLQPGRTATTVHRENGRVVVTDGPFMESKEGIGGYGIIDVPDLDAAIALAGSWPPGTRVEIRPIVEM
jgi:hypothetical protein